MIMFCTLKKCKSKYIIKIASNLGRSLIRFLCLLGKMVKMYLISIFFYIIHVKTFRVTTKGIEIECKIFKPKKGKMQ